MKLGSVEGKNYHRRKRFLKEDLTERERVLNESTLDINYDDVDDTEE